MSDIAQALRQLLAAMRRAGLAPPSEIRLADHDQFLRAFLLAAREQGLPDAGPECSWFDVDGMRVTYAGAVDQMLEQYRAEVQRRRPRPAAIAGRKLT